MGLNRSPLVNVFSSKILASVAGGARALRAARARVRRERGWERGSVAGSVSFCTRLVKYS